MPVKVQADLPVKEILERENIFVMDETRAVHQDIRPLKIVILNLMPLKEDTELQLLQHRLRVQRYASQIRPLSDLSGVRRCYRHPSIQTGLLRVYCCGTHKKMSDRLERLLHP